MSAFQAIQYMLILLEGSREDFFARIGKDFFTLCMAIKPYMETCDR
jgi:hypothetical protein